MHGRAVAAVQSRPVPRMRRAEATRVIILIARVGSVRRVAQVQVPVNQLRQAKMQGPPGGGRQR